MENKRILIIGGTGSLGTTLVSKWIQNNEILNISRDEEKQWKLKTLVNSPNLTQVIGDIRNYNEIKSSVYMFDPNVIVYVCALKHIDVCEKQPMNSIHVNIEGLNMIINDMASYRSNYKSLESLLFVSTDKACLPITVYGHCKAIAEKIIQTAKVPGVKLMAVRYGNVLNSSGSIIPLLHSMGKNSKYSTFSLTHNDMTRFIMRLDESVELIEYALNYGNNNEIVIIKLQSCRIKDMIELFSSIYAKDIKVTGLRCVEKIHEDLLGWNENMFAYKGKDNYIHITNTLQNTNESPFSSNDTLISKDELQKYLQFHNII
jgi:UDP-N-acetylglucosamine 4,6-dehydratase